MTATTEGTLRSPPNNDHGAPVPPPLFLPLSDNVNSNHSLEASQDGSEDTGDDSDLEPSEFTWSADHDEALCQCHPPELVNEICSPFGIRDILILG